MHSPLTHSHTAPSGWRLGQVHSGGAFPGLVFPSSSWNFQRATGPDTGRPPVPRCRANLSAPGAVPGNSSVSLCPPRLQETETQAPPLRRGPAEPSVGAGAGAGGPIPTRRPGRPLPHLRRRAGGGGPGAQHTHASHGIASSPARVAGVQRTAECPSGGDATRPSPEAV